MISKHTFTKQMLSFYDRQGRKDLPWQQSKNAYRVWVSEIMLQQTQVKTVIPYYLKFMESFPTLESLANADIDQVLQHWAGLGYYSRARNLHACARRVSEEHQGEFPRVLELITQLPGIGESTGGAILSLTHDLPEAILDGNVKRVLARVFLVNGWYGTNKVAKQLWTLSRKYTPTKRTGDFNQAMMDLGADICNRAKPRCSECPLSKDCLANLQNKTAEYPHRKPKKKIPTKQTVMHLVTDDKNRIQLVKRPPSGIWGGLWSLPELENNKLDDCDTTNAIEQFKHTFSHFHLEVQVVQNMDTTNSTRLNLQRVEDNYELAWHNIEQLHQLALPTPIKKFLFKQFNLS